MKPTKFGIIDIYGLDLIGRLNQQMFVIISEKREN